MSTWSAVYHCGSDVVYRAVTQSACPPVGGDSSAACACYLFVSAARALPVRRQTGTMMRSRKNWPEEPTKADNEDARDEWGWKG